MATTPPPPGRLRTPPTPRHGAGYDQYEPYSTRHSARLASQRPSAVPRSSSPIFGQSQSGMGSPRKQGNLGDGFRAVSPEPFNGSLRKAQRTDHTGDSGHLHSLRGTSDLFTSSSSHQHSPSSHLPHSSHSIMTDGMLPTPAKTPKKKAVGDAGSTARTLFSNVTPSGRGKKSKKPTAYSLESFEDDSGQNQAKIDIYTDSRDRIPEVDESEENPFYTKPVKGAGKASTRQSRGRKATEGPQRDTEIDNSLHREDGMYYVFRGKRFFRSFNEEPEAEADGDDEDLGLLASHPDLMDSSMTRPRPLTRSSIKPRVLFPNATKRDKEDAMVETDEEAATDVDDHASPKNAETNQTLDVEMQHDSVTPSVDSTVETPATPGASIRILRSQSRMEDIKGDVTPTNTHAKRKHMSPFNGWMRKKQSPASGASTPKKRDASNGSPGEPVTKRTRGNRVTLPS